MAQNDDPVVAKRRSFLQALGVSAGLATLGTTTAVSAAEDDTAPMSYELPDLPYAYDALEPHIDQRIMELHHGTHHQGYVDGANSALKKLAEIREAGEFEGIKHVKRDLSFNLSGHVNHTVFWENMSPDGGGEPDGGLRNNIEADFGSFEAFRSEFTEAANAVESNGWAMLFYEPVADRLIVGQVESQNQLAHQDSTPILALDVWEHAYYLQYEADRDEYVEAWWNVVDWDDVARRCRAVQSGEDPY
ncbi:superoxide dismutase [Saliphagus sp. LR7]|uniref:superoxide dismutase n=1 Tax=Saliphagus sp. LR7 TaxID=2282654 RepID=UPI000DF85EDE|nr:superoxide dismutase [Saliphagus sp. LR7]